MMSGSEIRSKSPRVNGYTFIEKLGSGSYSVVYKAVRELGNNETVAIKCIKKDKLQGSAADNVLTEIKLLKLLKHENIVEMKDFCWDNNYIYIILEYCNGGDLSNFIRRRRRLPEGICKKFSQQLALAMKYLRDNDVCHLDLKPPNLLLNKKSDLILKLSDFGFSQFLSIQDRKNTLRGSPLYMAPEMLLFQDYDAKADLWSIGVIMYECLFGKAPYSSNSIPELTEKLKMQKPIKIPEGVLISPECQDLLSRLLVHNPRDRISYDEFFAHAFLDLEHLPSPESYNKAVQLVCQAVEFDKDKKFIDAFNLYCEALRYFVPLIQAENNLKKKNALRAKVNEYITRAEKLKKLVHPKHDVQSSSENLGTHITQGAVFRELNLLCSDNPELIEALELGCTAEEHYSKGKYRLAYDKFQASIGILLPILAAEHKGRRRDLLSNQIQQWTKEAEMTKALLSAVDLNDANSAVEKGDSCRLQ